jgi:hypothetical protein
MPVPHAALASEEDHRSIMRGAYAPAADAQRLYKTWMRYDE